MNFFSFHHGKKIVLFIDDFDILLSHPESTHLINALNGMKVLSFFILLSFYLIHSLKEMPFGIYALHSVVAISTYKRNNSFLCNEYWEIPYFTQQQVKQLFQNFQQSYSLINNNILG